MKAKRAIGWALAVTLLLGFVYAAFRDNVTGSLAIGSPLPDLRLPSLAGGEASFSDWRGKPLVLWFTSASCVTCADDYPLLEEWQRVLGDEATIVSVQVGDDPATVSASLRGRQVGIGVYLDPTGDVARHVGLKTVPAFYFITARGTLSSVVHAEAARSDFGRHVQLALSGGPDLEETIQRVSRQLRCQECEGRSIWESDAPSSMAMRERVRQRLLAGERWDEVIDGFASEYGTWILLAPPARGLTALVWLLPAGALGVGAGAWWTLIVRARRKRRDEAEAAGAQPEQEADSKLIRRLDDYM